MGWIRLDDRFAEHRKITAISDGELRVHVNAMCFTARQQDPLITPGALRILGATRKQVNHLVDVGLWDAHDDGWVIHDWDEYQRRDTMDPMTNAERQARHRSRKRNGVSNADVTQRVTHGVTQRNERSNADA